MSRRLCASQSPAKHRDSYQYSADDGRNRDENPPSDAQSLGELFRASALLSDGSPFHFAGFCELAMA
jgi:hypothetical protein